MARQRASGQRRSAKAAASPRDATRKIHAPIVDFEGSVAGVAFAKGVGETSDARALAYFRRHGYGIGAPAAAPAADDRPAVEPIVSLGTLRDAAVDPKPEDFLAPVNAGEANPHGPLVVSPEIHAAEGPGGIRPGPVAVDEPEVQDAQESAHAAVTMAVDPDAGAAPTKKELLAMAAELGIEMPKRATNADISAAIAAARGEPS